MSDDNPISRLEFAKGEIDRVFGRGYSRDHPEVVNTVMLSASLDFLGLTVARAMRDVAAALLVEDAPAPGDGLFRPPTILR
jgi:hypothetical protein